MIIGILLVFAGAVAAAVELRLCRRIAQATTERSHGLRPVETWLNVYQFAKWRKLSEIANSVEESPELKGMARSALRLEKAFYALFLSGLVLMAIAAMCP